MRTLFEMATKTEKTGQNSQGATGGPLLLTAAQFACLLNLGTSTLWRLNAEGRIPLPVRIGRSIRWREREIRAWIDAGCPRREKWQRQGF